MTDQASATPTTAARLLAEGLGTALLLVLVVGSGITVSGDGDATTQLFAHAVVVGAGLAALIATLAPVSGAHLNPVVTAAAWWSGAIGTRLAGAYVAVQPVGAAVGVAVAHASVGLAPAAVATTPRDGIGLAVGEVVATAVLVLVILALVRTGRESAVPGAVGAWIAAAVVATSSAAFANPAVTLARTLTDTWTGITPASVPGFLLGQLAGLAVAVGTAEVLYGRVRRGAPGGDPEADRPSTDPHDPATTTTREDDRVRR